MCAFFWDAALGGHPKMPHPKNHTQLGSTQQVNNLHIKVRSTNRRLGVESIKMLINPPSFELGLMVDAKRAFVSVTPLNNFHAYSFDKSVSFVQSDMSETFLSVIGFF